MEIVDKDMAVALYKIALGIDGVIVGAGTFMYNLYGKAEILLFLILAGSLLVYICVALQMRLYNCDVLDSDIVHCIRVRQHKVWVNNETLIIVSKVIQLTDDIGSHYDAQSNILYVAYDIMVDGKIDVIDLNK